MRTMDVPGTLAAAAEATAVMRPPSGGELVVELKVRARKVPARTNRPSAPAPTRTAMT